MASQVMRITLKAYDHELVDSSAKKIIETVKKNGSQVSGPVPLPTKKEVVTILRATHKYKDSREQFEQRTHKRLIDIVTPTQKTVDALSRLEMPAGVYIDIKMKQKMLEECPVLAKHFTSAETEHYLLFQVDILDTEFH